MEEQLGPRSVIYVGVRYLSGVRAPRTVWTGPSSAADALPLPLRPLEPSDKDKWLKTIPAKQDTPPGKLCIITSLPWRSCKGTLRVFVRDQYAVLGGGHIAYVGYWLFFFLFFFFFCSRLQQSRWMSALLIDIRHQCTTIN